MNDQQLTINALAAEWRDVTFAMIDSKSYTLYLVTFSAGLTAMIKDVQQLVGTLEEVFYINLFYPLLIASMLFLSLVARVYVRLAFRRKQPLKISAWMVVNWPTHFVWLIFVMFCANTIHRQWAPGREMLMVVGTLPVIIIEAYLFGLFWFGEKDTLVGYLRRLARGMLTAQKLTKESVQDALEDLSGERETDDREPPSSAPS